MKHAKTTLSIAIAITSLNVAADCLDETALTEACYVPWSQLEAETPKAAARAATDNTAEKFSVWPALYITTMTQANIDGVAFALAQMHRDRSNLNLVFSFDAAPSSGSTGFAATASSVKGFYHKPVFDTKKCTVNFGDVDQNGALTCDVTGDSLEFGTVPEGNYTISYISDTLAFLAAKNAAATSPNINTFITGLFSAMTANAATNQGVYVGGSASTPAVLGYFKKSPTTGNWSFSGSAAKITYIPTTPGKYQPLGPEGLEQQ